MRIELLSKPLWQMTGEEFLELNSQAAFYRKPEEPITESSTTEKRYVYGIAGIAQIFGCSIPTANHIKKSGRIDGAIRQIGRKIVVDVEKALELAGRKMTDRNKK